MKLKSVLFTPGDREKALAKTSEHAADGFIWDLEDAVHPSAKESARSMVVQNVGKVQTEVGERPLVVRMNSLHSPWGAADLESFAVVSRIAVPKVESERDFLPIVEKYPQVKIWPMIETARGVWQLKDWLGKYSQVECLVVGTSDLSRDLRIAVTKKRRALMTALQTLVLAARAFDLKVLDGVFLKLDDEEGLRKECRQGKKLGFDGKTLIHPKMIEIANQEFAPDKFEIAWAERVLHHYNPESQEVVVIEGQLVERLHFERAKEILESV